MSIKIVSFNVLAEAFIDYNDLSMYYPGIPAKIMKFDKRMPKIISYIVKAKADIILLQEITPITAKMLRNIFSPNYYVMPIALHETDEALQKGNAYGNLTMIRKPFKPPLSPMQTKDKVKQFVSYDKQSTNSRSNPSNSNSRNTRNNSRNQSTTPQPNKRSNLRVKVKFTKPSTPTYTVSYNINTSQLNASSTNTASPTNISGGYDAANTSYPDINFGDIIAIGGAYQFTPQLIFTKPSQRVYRVPVLGTAFSITEFYHKKTQIAVINIHLDSDEETEKKRREEIKLLMEFIKPLLKTSVVILTGDFNTANAATHKSFSVMKSVVKKHKGTYLAEKHMIDWIYVANAKILDGYVDKPPRADIQTPLKKFGSDHYPVVGVIELVNA